MRDDHLRRRARRQTPTRTSGPTPSRAGGARAGWPARSSSRVASAVSASPITAAASGVAPPVPRSARGAPARPDRRARVVPLPPAPARRSASVSSGRPRAAVCSGSDGMPRQQPARSADQALHRARVEQVRVVLRATARSRRPAPRATGQVELGAIASPTPNGAARSPGSRNAVRRRVLQREQHLEQRRAARLRSGCSSSTSFSNGTSWCAYAPSAVSRTCAEQLAEGRIAAPGRRAAPGC